MTTLEVLNLKALLLLTKKWVGREWTIMTIRNMKLLDAEIDVYQRAWEKTRLELVEKDGKGVPVVKDGKYIPKNQEEFDKEHNAFLNRKVDVQLVKISAEDVPNEASPEIMGALWDYLIEDEQAITNRTIPV